MADDGELAVKVDHFQFPVDVVHQVIFQEILLGAATESVDDTVVTIMMIGGTGRFLIYVCFMIYELYRRFPKISVPSNIQISLFQYIEIGTHSFRPKSPSPGFHSPAPSTPAQ